EAARQANVAPTEIAFASGGSVGETVSDGGTIGAAYDPSGATVATLSATDANAGDSHSFTLVSDPSGKFEIVGDEVRVKSGQTIDFETDESFDLTIEATDQFGATYQDTLTIDVVDYEGAYTGGVGGETIAGSSEEDVITGGDGADTISGGDGDDVIEAGAGDDVVYGGEGQDTVSFGGDAEDYDVRDNGDGSYTVTDLNAADGDDGTDILSGVEQVVFGGEAAVGIDTVVQSAPTDLSFTSYADPGAHEAVAVSGGDAPSYAANTVVMGASGGDADASANFQVSWDADGITVFATVADDAVVSDSAASQLWNDDSIEIYFDFNQDGGATYGADDFQFLVGQGTDNVNLHLDGALQSDLSGVSSESAIVSGGYTVSFNASWAALGVDAPLDGESIGFAFAINDDDDGGDRDAQIMWDTSASDLWTTPENFGSLTFDDGSVTLSELAADGDAVTVAAAEDADGVSDIVYSLSDDADGAFEIDAATGEITVKDASKIDPGTASEMAVTVVATDANGAGESYSEALTIRIAEAGDLEFVADDAGSSHTSGSGDDTLTGGAGSDALNGGRGDDSISGGGSADTLTGGAGDDTLDGGGAERGWSYEYYDLTSAPSSLADAGFTENGGRDNSFTATATGTTTDLDPSAIDNGDNFALKFNTVLTIDQAGDYTFQTYADDGVKLFLDGVEIIVDDFTHSARTTDSAPQTLAPGEYTLEVVYFEHGGRETLDVRMSGPDTGDSMTSLADYSGVATAQGGTDTAVYAGDQADFAVAYDASSGAFVLVDQDTADGLDEGTDVVTNVESFEFNGAVVSAEDLAASALDLSEGTSGGETMTGGDDAEMIRGLGGADTLYGGGGADLLYGGDGGDLLVGGESVISTVYSSDFEGDISEWTGSGAATSTFDGDQVLGSWRNSDGAGAELATTTLSGLEDGQSLQVSFDAYMVDDLNGGEGLEVYVDGALAFRVYDNGSINSLDSSLASNVTYSLAASGDYGSPYEGGSTDERYTVTFDAMVGGSEISFGFGSNLNSNDEGVAVDNFTVATVVADDAAADTLSGGAGDDTLDGGDGTDTAVYDGAAADYVATLYGGGFQVVDQRDGAPDGTDEVYNVEALEFSNGTFSVTLGTSGADTLSGGSDQDALIGGDGGDEISGGGGADLLYGGAGGDVLNGGIGDDTMIGGDGDDTFLLAIGDGRDVIDGGAGGSWTDTIELDGASLGDTRDASTATSFDGGDWTVTLTSGTIEAENGSELVFSEDAAGAISFDDGSQSVEFSNIEALTWNG
ncbi:MAG: sugar-binding protein, partial [Pseudomonadota bacterium]